MYCITINLSYKIYNLFRKKLDKPWQKYNNSHIHSLTSLHDTNETIHFKTHYTSIHDCAAHLPSCTPISYILHTESSYTIFVSKEF